MIDLKLISYICLLVFIFGILWLVIAPYSKKGNKCFLIYLIQRNDVDRFSIAKDLDNEYYENSLIAKKSGVQFRAFKCNVSYKGINITGEINIDEN